MAALFLYLTKLKLRTASDVLWKNVFKQKLRKKCCSLSIIIFRSISIYISMLNIISIAIALSFFLSPSLCFGQVEVKGELGILDVCFIFSRNCTASW